MNIEERDDVIDLTDEFVNYKYGKGLECECGLDIGMEYDKNYYKCPRCNKLIYDAKCGEREYEPETVDGNTTLDQFT